MKRGLVIAVLATAACHDVSLIQDPRKRTDGGADGACKAGQMMQGGACVTVPRSCRDLSSICGPMKNENCCAYDTVPMGIFSRGYDKSNVSVQDGKPVVGWQTERAAEAIVSTFFLDRYEVTIGRFRAFLEDYDHWLSNNPESGHGGHPYNPDGGWKPAWTHDAMLYSQSVAALRAQMPMKPVCSPKILQRIDDPMRLDDAKPMTCVNWYEAYLFCIWDGARLPTEAEWNYAAAAGAEQRAYPWGMPADPSLKIPAGYANTGKLGGDLYLEDVGSEAFAAGRGLFGQYDLAGNAWEFVHDTADLMPTTYTMMKSNPLDISKTERLVRGGSYKYEDVRARTAYRQTLGNFVTFRYDDTGWRCAGPAVPDARK